MCAVHVVDLLHEHVEGLDLEATLPEDVVRGLRLVIVQRHLQPPSRYVKVAPLVATRKCCYISNRQHCSCAGKMTDISGIIG